MGRSTKLAQWVAFPITRGRVKQNLGLFSGPLSALLEPESVTHPGGGEGASIADDGIHACLDATRNPLPEAAMETATRMNVRENPFQDAVRAGPGEH